MLEYLINVDKAVFHFFNTAIANPLFDLIMPIITNQNIWVIPILIGNNRHNQIKKRVSYCSIEKMKNRLININ
jgi:hypothetical protein